VTVDKTYIGHHVKQDTLKWCGNAYDNPRDHRWLAAEQSCQTRSPGLLEGFWSGSYRF
jgi:hypothetical protein